MSQGSNNQGNETETTKSNAAPSPLLCSTSNGAPAISISFNPKDKRVLCTSNPGFGGIGRTDRVGTEVDSSVDELDVNVMIGSNIGLCRGIHFWKIEMRYRKWDLRSM